MNWPLTSRRIVFALFAVAAAARPAAQEQRLSFEARLRHALTDIVSAEGLPGATAAVSIGGKVTTVAVGFADRERRVPMTPEHRMLVGSAGKPFFAFIVLTAVAEGKIDLDTPVSRWLGAEPWFSR